MLYTKLTYSYYIFSCNVWTKQLTHIIAAGNDGLHEVTTFQVDQRVRECAELTGDSMLLAKLFAGDMVALEAKYHSKCLLALYHRAEKVHTERSTY